MNMKLQLVVDGMTYDLSGIERMTINSDGDLEIVECNENAYHNIILRIDKKERT